MYVACRSRWAWSLLLGVVESLLLFGVGIDDGVGLRMVLEVEVLSSDRLRAASRSDVVKVVPSLMLVRERAAWRSSSVRGGVVVAVGDVVVLALLSVD